MTPRTQVPALSAAGWEEMDPLQKATGALSSAQAAAGALCWHQAVACCQGCIPLSPVLVWCARPNVCHPRPPALPPPIELYMGQRGFLFWANKAALWSVGGLLVGWALFRFVGPALGLYKLANDL